MKMSNCLFCISFLLWATCASGQRLSQVSFSNGSNLSFVSVLTDQGVQIRISEDGKVLEWGTEVMSDRSNYYAPKLQPFLARTEYFDAGSDPLFSGKVKSIGATFITYYGSSETVHKKGKLKSIGSLQFDYFSDFDDKSMQGKIKLVGTNNLEFYRAYENESFRGKLKSIGNMPITYYSTFDDKYNAGKIKSIASVPYQWYSNFDGYAKGGLKSNNYRQLIGSITFILR
jgi:hypothetical protein